MLDANVHKSTDCSRADVFGGCAGRKLERQPIDWHRQERLQRLERSRVRAAIEENAEHARQGQAAAFGGGHEARDLVDVIVTHDLSQVELTKKIRRSEVI